MIVRDPCRPEGFVVCSSGPVDRALAHLLSSRLDSQLAAGRLPESNRLLATRAEQLVSPSRRSALAQNWLGLLEHAHLPPVPRDPRVPPCRARIISAELEIRAMLSALVNPLPVSARGVAKVSLLLCNGAGPLYDPRCAQDLTDVLTGAIGDLDPAVGLDDAR
jgi:hypothetical protein